MKITKDYEALKKQFNKIISKGQDQEDSVSFSEKPIGYAEKAIVTSLILIGLTFIITYYYSEHVIHKPFNSTESWTVFFDMLKITIGSVVALSVTIFATNRWQQRSYSFEMIKELNSKEFLEVRNNLSNQMRRARISGKDVDDLESWFPFNDWFIRDILTNEMPQSPKTSEDFISEHALPSMLYFILRLSNYYKFDMLNQKLTKHLFHFFFCHYEVVMLEFASMLRKTRERLNNEGWRYDERWNLVADDIESFFTIIGLQNSLTKDHIFIYFPSLNDFESSIKSGV